MGPILAARRSQAKGRSFQRGAWQRADDQGPARLARRTSPSPARQDAGQTAFSTQLAIGADGTAAVAWRRNDGSKYLAQAIVYDDLFAVPVPPVPDTSAIKGKNVITKAKAKYTFTSPNPGATFECRVDKKFKKYAGVSKKKAKKKVPWKACSSPYVVKAKTLKNGKHKLYVRAVVNAQVDPSPSVKKIKVRLP